MASDSAESCNTVGLNLPGPVNLEKALRLNDVIGGHLVSGHVDGVGEVLRFDPVGDNRLLEIRAPQEIAKFIARKGSIVVDGTSLTTNDVRGTDFTIYADQNATRITVLSGGVVVSAVNAAAPSEKVRTATVWDSLCAWVIEFFGRTPLVGRATSARSLNNLLCVTTAALTCMRAVTSIRICWVDFPNTAMCFPSLVGYACPTTWTMLSLACAAAPSVR